MTRVAHEIALPGLTTMPIDTHPDARALVEARALHLAGHCLSCENCVRMLATALTAARAAGRREMRDQIAEYLWPLNAERAIVYVPGTPSEHVASVRQHLAENVRSLDPDAEGK